MRTNPFACYGQPTGLLAGFHADLPDVNVPELLHVGEQWASRRLFVTNHSHPVWEFYLQISGESRWDSPGRTDTLTPGGFFAAPPLMPHQMHDRPEDKHHFFFAALDLAAVFPRLPALAPPWQRDTIVFLPHSETLLAPFRQLVREVSLALPHRASGMRLALDALVLEASRLLEASVTSPPKPLSLTVRHPAVRQAKELLDHQPSRVWRLADLARMVGVSAHHLVECFTREVGVSPRQYLLSVRVRHAQEMLAGSDIAITDLALELGFSSSQHFAATFKRLTGETAQGYRGRMNPA
jgi:AraC-like DNA-binding protein